jgi:hypothetical protein
MFSSNWTDSNQQPLGKIFKNLFFGLLVNLPQGDMSPDDGQDGFDGNPDLFVL